MESPHFFALNDTVGDRNGGVATVVDCGALWAELRYPDGHLIHVDQFDPEYRVIERAPRSYDEEPAMLL